MRTFIAFPLSPEIKELLEKIQAEIKTCVIDAKWVNPFNTHITLKFLGEIQENTLLKVEQIIVKTADEFSSLKIYLKSFGFFPTERNPRVFFIATDKEDFLKQIASFLENNLQALGFKKENRFKSHITLARLKSKKNIGCILEKIKAIELTKTFLIKEIVLFKSTLTSKGPEYEKIFKARLKEPSI